MTHMEPVHSGNVTKETVRQRIETPGRCAMATNSYGIVKWVYGLLMGLSEHDGLCHTFEIRDPYNFVVLLLPEAVTEAQIRDTIKNFNTTIIAKSDLKVVIEPRRRALLLSIAENMEELRASFDQFFLDVAMPESEARTCRQCGDRYTSSDNEPVARHFCCEVCAQDYLLSHGSLPEV